MRVLLIEPDQRTAHDTARFLSKTHAVRVAPDGHVAIQLIDANTPDVIVLEPAMPAHNGIEFLYELRSYEDLMSIPIIVFSTLSPEKFMLDEVRQTQLGVVQICEKSRTSLKRLQSILQEVVQTPA